MMRYCTTPTTLLLALGIASCSPKIEVQPVAPISPPAAPTAVMRADGGCEAMRPFFPLSFYYVAGLPPKARDAAANTVKANAAFAKACP